MRPTYTASTPATTVENDVSQTRPAVWACTQVSLLCAAQLQTGLQQPTRQIGGYSRGVARRAPAHEPPAQAMRYSREPRPTRERGLGH